MLARYMLSSCVCVCARACMHAFVHASVTRRYCIKTWLTQNHAYTNPYDSPVRSRRSASAATGAPGRPSKPARRPSELVAAEVMKWNEGKYRLKASVFGASLAIRIAEQSANVIDHVVPRLSVRTPVLWQNG